MSLLESIEKIQKHSKTDLQELEKSELISLVLSSQLVIDSLKSSKSLQTTERNTPKKKTQRRRTLKTFDSFYTTLELNPHHISHQSYTEFDSKNFSVKNFIEMQHRKICFQEQKIKELQVKRLKRTICTDRPNTINKSTLMFNIAQEKSKILTGKIESLLKKPNSVMLIGKNYEIPRVFANNDKKIIEHREVCEKEVDKCYAGLVSKYGERVFAGIIGKRSKWDMEYKETFAENLKLLERTKESFLNSKKVIETFKGPESEKFSEGKIVRSVIFNCERISMVKARKRVFGTLQRTVEIDPDTIEVLISW